MSGASSTAFSNASGASPAVEISASGESACFSIPSNIGLSSTSRTLTLLGIENYLPLLLTLAAVVAALPARFSFQPQIADLDPLIQSLAHVIDSHRGNPGRHQRFHL